LRSIRDRRDPLDDRKLAEQGRVNIQTIRYYERRGLLPEPRRSRPLSAYDVDAVIRLGFISKAQRLDFP